MLNKKTVKNILLEVEANCYHYEEYLQEIVNIVLNENNKDVKYIITREKNYNYLHLYKYSESDYITWLYNNYNNIDNLRELKNNYSIIREYIQKNYIDYYIEENITNFLTLIKFVIFSSI